MKQTFPIRPLVYVLAFVAAFSSCSKIGIVEGVSPSTGTDDAYTSAFYSNLISAGMSASDAAYVSGYTGNAASAFVSNLLAVDAASSDTIDKAKNSSSAALGKVSDNDHFPNASSKQDAVELISQAQFETLAELVDEADLPSAVDEVAGTLASEIESTGLTSSDLQEALERQGKGIAKGLIESSVDSSKHGDVMNSFSKGAVEGLLNNPNLSSSGVDLIGALTQGLLGEVGNENGGKLTDEGKGLIIREILKGIKDQIDADNNLSDDDKTDYVSEIYDNAGSTISDSGSSIVDKVQEGLFSSDAEIHAVSIYTAGPSSGWVPGPTSGTLVSSHWDGSATINIAAGTKPIVLALTSYEGVNWTITGATSRVSKVIAHGFYDQFVSGVDASKVSMHSYESGSNMYFYGIVSSNWYLNFAEPWTQAVLVKIRQDVGAPLVSYQSAYDQQAFVVGDGNNAAGALPTLSFVRPWLYPLNYNGAIGSQVSGGPKVYTVLALTHALSVPINVRVWTENITTTSANLPAYDQVHTLAAGSRFITLNIPINQDNSITESRTFKINMSAPDDVFTFTKSFTATILGGTGSTSGTSTGGTSGTTTGGSTSGTTTGGSTSGTTTGGSGGGSTSGGSNSSTIRSKYASVSVDGSGLATIQFAHTHLDPMMCSNVTYTYNVVLDTAHSANAAFVAAYPSASNQWISLSLACPSAPSSSINGDPDWYSQKTVTYPSGCTVSSYSASSQPSTLMCF
jgi:hypothetical protein